MKCLENVCWLAELGRNRNELWSQTDLHIIAKVALTLRASVSLFVKGGTIDPMKVVLRITNIKSMASHYMVIIEDGISEGVNKQNCML